MFVEKTQKKTLFFYKRFMFQFMDNILDKSFCSQSTKTGINIEPNQHNNSMITICSLTFIIVVVVVLMENLYFLSILFSKAYVDEDFFCSLTKMQRDIACG